MCVFALVMGFSIINWTNGRTERKRNIDIFAGLSKEGTERERNEKKTHENETERNETEWEMPVWNVTLNSFNKILHGIDSDIYGWVSWNEGWRERLRWMKIFCYILRAREE